MFPGNLNPVAFRVNSFTMFSYTCNNLPLSCNRSPSCTMTSELPSLSGKVCIVTGASRGIGKGIALMLAKAGATVYITGQFDFSANCLMV